MDYRRVELDGIPYVILRESVFDHLCQAAGIEQTRATRSDDSITPAIDLDRASLADRIKRRRHAAGLSQTDLAHRAGIRPETLNRIERGRTTPDFVTIRKLVLAMNEAERQYAANELSKPPSKEPSNAERE